MKTIQKILFGALLIGIGCLTSTKVVKADATTVALYYDPDAESLSYQVTNATENDKLIISVDGTDKPAITLPGGTSANPLAGNRAEIVAYLGDPAATTQVEVSAQMKHADDTPIAGATDSKNIDIYVFTPTVDDADKLSITSPASVPYKSLKNTYTLTVKAIRVPYYIEKVDGSYQNTLNYTGTWNKDVHVTSKRETATISLSDTGSSPITATITWTPDAYSGYKNCELINAVGPINMDPFSAPYNKAYMSYTGSGSGELIVKVGNTAGDAEQVGNLAFTYARSPKSVAITKKLSAIKPGDTSSAGDFVAVVYDNEGNEMPGEAVSWEIVTKTPDDMDSSMNADTGILTAGTKEGLLKIRAKSASAPTIRSEQIDVQVTDVANISLAVSGATLGFPVSLSKYTTVSPGGANVTWVVTSGASTINASGQLNPAIADVGGSVELTPKIGAKTYPAFKKTIPIYDVIEIKSDEGGSKSDIKFSLPRAVYTKMDSGSKEQNNIPNVTGYYVYFYDTSNKFVASSDFISATPGSSITLEGDELEKIIEKMGDDGKLSSSGDTGNFTLTPHIVPAGYSEKSTSEIVGNTAAEKVAKNRTVYYIKIKGDNNIEKVKKSGKNTYDWNTFTPSDGRTFYGQSGYEATISVDAKSGYKFARWEDDNTNNPRTYKFGESYESKKLKALTDSGSSSSKSSSAQASASGAGSGNAGGKLDKVPKTGEGNTRMLIIMIAMISATIAGAILLSYMPARANANKGIGGAEDVKGFFDSVSTTSTKDTKTEQTTADNADKDDKQS